MTAATKIQEQFYSDIWVGCAQQMLCAVKPYLNDNIGILTAGWVLEILHNRSGVVTQEDRTIIQNILLNYPCFTPSEEGLYHYIFFRQLEFVCEVAQNAYSRKLIQL